MRRLHLLTGGRPHDEDPEDQPEPRDPLTRALRDAYASPSEGYWDSLEARVMAAVRAGRGAPTAVAEWWHTLADWARPGVAAAGLLLAVGSAAVLQARVASQSASTAIEIAPIDADLARALDLVPGDSASAEAAREARDAADLLVDGVYRRPSVPLPERGRERTFRAADDERDEVLRARREATFRYVMP